MKTRKRNGGYLSFPDAMQQRTDLSAVEKDVLAAIGRRMGRGGTCTMGSAEIAKQIGVKKLDTVADAVERLAEKDELKFLRRKRTTPDGKIENLKTIYCAKWAYVRNMRWKHWDQANLRELEKSGKIKTLPTPLNGVPSPAERVYKDTVHLKKRDASA